MRPESLLFESLRWLPWRHRVETLDGGLEVDVLFQLVCQEQNQRAIAIEQSVWSGRTPYGSEPERIIQVRIYRNSGRFDRWCQIKSEMHPWAERITE